jgi:hypothetical protein
MAFLPRFVAILAILALPRCILAQGAEPAQYRVPASLAALPWTAQPWTAQPPADAPTANIQLAAAQTAIIPLPQEPDSFVAVDLADRPAAPVCNCGACLECWLRLCSNYIRINETPPEGPPKHSLFVFGGMLTTGSMGDTLDIFNVTYDQNYVIALVYQRYLVSTGGFHWGWEVGTAGRYSDGHSQEFWGGATVRHNGITLLNFLRIMPSATAGFSIVTDTMGHEVNRERARKGDGTFLYYLGPEFAAALTSHPNIEMFYRLHHRCGGGGTLGHMREGYNANVVGLRIRF